MSNCGWELAFDVDVIKKNSWKWNISINGQDYTTDTTYGLKDWAGSALPTVYGALRIGLQWKGLSLDLLMTYSLGGKVYDSSYQSLMSTYDT